MNIEIHEPELEQRVRAYIQSGRFRDVDELFRKAFDAMEVAGAVPSCSQGRQTGAIILEALQASPYPEIDLAPARVPILVRDIEL